MSQPFTDPPDQLGCVVPDLDAAIAEWAAQGVGPFLTMRKVGIAGYRYEGRRSKPRIDFAFSQQGEMQIELIQPIDDEPSGYRDFLAAGNSGAHHHAWFCDDYQAQVEAAARAGRTELQSGSWGAVHFIYYHPLEGEERIGELVEMNDVNRGVFALIREQAEQWDGTRPSRSMLGTAGWGLRWTAAKAEIAARLGRS